MAAKQEVITEAAEGVVPVSTRARAPSAGVALQLFLVMVLNLYLTSA